MGIVLLLLHLADPLPTLSPAGLSQAVLLGNQWLTATSQPTTTAIYQYVCPVCEAVLSRVRRLLFAFTTYCRRVCLQLLPDKNWMEQTQPDVPVDHAHHHCLHFLAKTSEVTCILPSLSTETGSDLAQSTNQNDHR